MEFAMDVHFVMTWNAPLPGSGKKGLEFVIELEKYWDRHAAEGQCTTPDVFLLANGPGTFTVKGERRFLEDLAASEELRELLAKGRLVFQDWQYGFAETGNPIEPGVEDSVGAGLNARS
jgi:hypothetical protein